MLHVARWNGSVWSPLGTGPNNGVDDPVYFVNVFGIAVSGNKVYVGGSFTLAGGSIANNVAVFDGTAWSNMTGGADQGVFSVVAVGNQIYAAGAFSQVGGIAARSVARWDGTQWSALGEGLVCCVSEIASIGPNIYFSGSADASASDPTSQIAKWDGLQWSRIGDGLATNGLLSYAGTMAANATDLYVGGNFGEIGGLVSSHIARWTPPPDLLRNGFE
jgi:trimeric autotransporter adhesin